MNRNALTACAVAALLGNAANAAEFDCLIEARQQVEIRSPVEAVIESVQVQRGDLVKTGSVANPPEFRSERAVFNLSGRVPPYGTS